jgi:hypothetical protein
MNFICTEGINEPNSPSITVILVALLKPVETKNNIPNTRMLLIICWFKLDTALVLKRNSSVINYGAV